nr:MAG TPA: cytidylyltransferase-like protein [Caudoviricetes sp.]
MICPAIFAQILPKISKNKVLEGSIYSILPKKFCGQ